jgi:hypothetical protein
MHAVSCPVPAVGCAYGRTKDEGNTQVAKTDVSDEEGQAIREEKRALDRLVEALQGGEFARIALTRRNPMRGVVASAETFSVMQRAPGEDSAAP